MTIPAYDLSGRVILITGATRGLGRMLANTCHAAGARIAIVGRGAELTGVPDAPGTADSDRVLRIRADLEDASVRARVAEEISKTFGRLDGVVHNAAAQGPIGPLDANDWVEWERTIRLNLLVPVALTQACLPLFGEGPHRRKLVFVSGGGATSPRPRFSAYATAKAGLVRFAETIAVELVDRRIDVNCVAPGAMPSAMTAAVLKAGAEAAGAREYETAKRLTAESSDVAPRAAALCAFLLSAASDGVTGRLLAALWDPWPDLPTYRDELAATDVYTLRRIVPEDRNRKWG